MDVIEDAGDVSLVNFQVTASDALRTAGNLWAGETLPDWRENEYLRGQVETLADLFGSPFESERDWEDVKDWYAARIGGNA
jgi:hypothetical protein